VLKVTAKGVCAARTQIDPVFLDTPVIRPVALSRELGVQLLFKDETVNPIGSFKGRGASVMVRSYPPGAHFVCGSAGNFGQGMAWATRAHGCSLTVFAAETAVQCKLDAMRAFGASVQLSGRDFDEAKDGARQHAETSGAIYIEDGAHHEIAEGAGTLAVEIVEAEDRIDAVFVPLGNGALAAGVGCWMKTALPGVRVIAVAAAGAPSMGRAVLGQGYDPLAPPQTIADGIAVRVPIPSAVEAVRHWVDEVILVDEAEIIRAVRMLEVSSGHRVEPAGAAGFAGLLRQANRWRGTHVAIPICGRNRIEHLTDD
jgi:threonine dehydratase